MSGNVAVQSMALRSYTAAEMQTLALFWAGLQKLDSLMIKNQGARRAEDKPLSSSVLRPLLGEVVR